MSELPSLADHLDAQGASVLVVSPHLDDAAYSLGDLLTQVQDRARVLTVFTAANADTDSGWAKTTGFADAVEEYAARVTEDAAAMARMGVAYAHAGGLFGDRSEATAAQMIGAIRAQIDGPVYVLLPLGAGGVSSGFDRLRRRVLRKPFGAPPHTDHLWVRDQVQAALSEAAGVTLGYYAEIPYQWSNAPAELAALAGALIKGDMGRIAHRPTLDFKHGLALDYASQAAHILGPDPAYQRKVCAALETVFIPV